MRKQLLCGIVLALSLSAIAFFSTRERSEAADEKGPMLVHDVYFSLKDNSDEMKQKLVTACKKHLTEHPGELHFASGKRAVDFNREINDADFDVSLHIVFKDKDAHDKYQEARRHQQFIEENKDNWKKVRVFDSYATK